MSDCQNLTSSDPGSMFTWGKSKAEKISMMAIVIRLPTAVVIKNKACSTDFIEGGARENNTKLHNGWYWNIHLDCMRTPGWWWRTGSPRWWRWCTGAGATWCGSCCPPLPTPPQTAGTDRQIDKVEDLTWRTYILLSYEDVVAGTHFVAVGERYIPLIGRFLTSGCNGVPGNKMFQPRNV